MQPVSWLPDWLSYPLYAIWLNQTLIAGILALFAGLLTVHYLKKQIGLQQRTQEDAQERRLRMHRAGLPAALAELSDYAEACVHQRWCLLHNEPLSGTRSRLQKIDLPKGAIRALQSAVEALDENVQTEIEHLLSFYQVYTSRLGTRFFELDSEFKCYHNLKETDIYRNILDGILLRAATARLFDFSRRRSESVAHWHDAESACFAVTSIVLPNGGRKPSDYELENYIRSNWQREVQRYAE